MVVDIALDALNYGQYQVREARIQVSCWCNESVVPLMSVGSPHTSYCTPEGSKVGRHHGDVEGSASHSEQHNTTM